MAPPYLRFFVSAAIPAVFGGWQAGFYRRDNKSRRGGTCLYPFIFLFCLGVFMWMLLFINLTNYYLDVWYVTSDRLVDIEQKGLFHRDEAVLRLDNIQDVAIASKGIIQTLLGFGNIRVKLREKKRIYYEKYRQS